MTLRDRDGGSCRGGQVPPLRSPGGRSRPKRALLAVIALPSAGLLSLALWGCGGETQPLAAGSASSKVDPPKAVPAAPKRAEADPNPFGLPPHKLELAPGSRVFAVPEVMLRGAKEGSALHLRSAIVTGADGDDLLVDGRDGPPYRIHPGYLIAFQPAGRPKTERPVLAELAGALRHGVVLRYDKDKIVVRMTDTSDKIERALPLDQVVQKEDGLRAGNFALLRKGADYEHIMIVSKLEGKESFLTIGFAGKSRIAEGTDLTIVPNSYLPKPKTRVWAVHLGKAREGEVVSIDRPGLATVQFDRAGRPVSVGYGFLMPPLGPPRGR